MSFIPMLASHGRGPAPERVRLHLCAYGRFGERRRLTFVISRKVLDRLGWQVGERVVVCLGTGDDAGSFQMSRSANSRAGLKLTSFSGYSSARVSLSLPEEAHGVRPADLLDGLALPLDLDLTIDGAILTLALPALAARSPRLVVTGTGGM